MSLSRFALIYWCVRDRQFQWNEDMYFLLVSCMYYYTAHCWPSHCCIFLSNKFCRSRLSLRTATPFPSLYNAYLSSSFTSLCLVDLATPPLLVTSTFLLDLYNTLPRVIVLLVFHLFLGAALSRPSGRAYLSYLAPVSHTAISGECDEPDRAFLCLNWPFYLLLFLNRAYLFSKF